MESVDCISAATIQGKKYNLVIFFSVAGLAILLAFIGIASKSAPAIIIGTILIVVIPSVFEKRIKSMFSNNVEVEVTDQFLSINFFELDGADLNKKEIVAFNDLASFRTTRAMYENTILLELYLRSGAMVKYTFLNQGSKSKSNVINPFFAHVKNFNRSQNKIQIGIRRSFIASKAGLYSLGLISMLLVVCLATHLILNPLAISLSILPGVIAYLSLISMRRGELALVKKLNEDKED